MVCHCLAFKWCVNRLNNRLGEQCSEEGVQGGGSLDCGLTSVEAAALGSGVSTTSSGCRRDFLLDGEGSLGSCQACPAAP